MGAKIEIIIDDIPNGAGTERAVSSFCNGLLKFYPHSYQITIISIFSNKDQHCFFELDSKINIQHLEKRNDFTLWNKFNWYQDLVAKIRKTNCENSFDIMLGTTYIHNILLPLFVNKSNTKTIGCEHVVFDYPPKLWQQIRKIVYPKLNKVIVLNEAEQRKFYFLKNAAVIPNNLPFENNETASLTNKSIISVGRLTYEKGIDMLIDIYENIYREAADWKLNIFGDGQDFELLQSKIQEKGLENYIKLHGSVKNISENYLQNSIFVLTSRSESFGIAIIEAMNHGLPVVSFDCDGPKNIIDNNESGFLIPQFDKKEFSKKLLFLINDEHKRKEMGKTAMAASLRFKEINIIPLWNKQLQLILKDHLSN